MASASDIAVVRENTNEPTEATYTDDRLGELIDELGVAGASARIWRTKAAKFAALVDTSTAGTTEKFSDLHKTALAMETKFTAEAALLLGVPADAPVVYDIVRET